MVAHINAICGCLLFIFIFETRLPTIFGHKSHLPYKVFRISPQNWDDMLSIEKLRQSLSEENEIDFWLDAKKPKQITELMVAPFAFRKFKDFMFRHSLNYTVVVDDVEELIRVNEVVGSGTSINSHPSSSHRQHSTECHHQNCSPNNIKIKEFMRSRLRDEPSAETTAVQFEERLERVSELRASYPFGMYTDYAAMVRYMRMLDFYYPHIVRVVQIGKTHEGRSIEGVMIGYPITNNTKRVFWIDGNIHAREWASSHTAMFLINQLVAGYGKNAEITHYLNSINFLIVPCANPDGYEYSRSSIKPQIRLWRKNRSPERCVPSVWGGVRCCQGVDLNRNFDFHWAETGSSSNPCSNLYAGTETFSEPESRAIFDYLYSPELYGRVDAFITLHTYAQMWIYPYSHELNSHPQDHEALKNVARIAVERLGKVYGTHYRIGTGAELLSPASGGSDDWAKEKLGVKFVYLVELRPQLEQSQGFILKQEQLIPTAIETFEGIKAVADSVLQYNYISRRTEKPNHQINQSTRSPSPTITRIQTQTTTPVFAENDMVDPRDKRVDFDDMKMTFENGSLTEDPTIAKSVTEIIKDVQNNGHESNVRPNITAQGASFKDQILRVDFGREEQQKVTRFKQPLTIVTMPTTHSVAEVNTVGSIVPEQEEILSVTTLLTDQTTNRLLSTSTTAAERIDPIIIVGLETTATNTSTATLLTATTPTTATSPTTTATTTPITTTTATTTTTTTLTTTTAMTEILTKALTSRNPDSAFRTINVHTQKSTVDSEAPIPTMDWLTTSVLFSVTAIPNEELREAVVVTTQAPTLQYAPRFLTQPIAPLTPSAPFVANALPFLSRSDTKLPKAFNAPLHRDIPERNTSAMAMIVAPLYAFAESPHIVNNTAVESSTASHVEQLSSVVALKPECRDRKYSCVFWIRANPSICQEKQHFMRTNCEFSCKFCLLTHR